MPESFVGIDNTPGASGSTRRNLGFALNSTRKDWFIFAGSDHCGIPVFKFYSFKLLYLLTGNCYLFYLYIETHTVANERQTKYSREYSGRNDSTRNDHAIGCSSLIILTLAAKKNKQKSMAIWLLVERCCDNCGEKKQFATLIDCLLAVKQWRLCLGRNVFLTT